MSKRREYASRQARCSRGSPLRIELPRTGWIRPRKATGPPRLDLPRLTDLPESRQSASSARMPRVPVVRVRHARAPHGRYSVSLHPSRSTRSNNRRHCRSAVAIREGQRLAADHDCEPSILTRCVRADSASPATSALRLNTVNDVDCITQLNVYVLLANSHAGYIR